MTWDVWVERQAKELDGKDGVIGTGIGIFVLEAMEDSLHSVLRGSRSIAALAGRSSHLPGCVLCLVTVRGFRTTMEGTMGSTPSCHKSEPVRLNGS